MTIYVDLDGVLANFDKAAEGILGTNNIYKYEFIWGPDKFWEKLNTRYTFFADMEPMRDAFELWRNIRHLKPVILTALPRENGERVAEQKIKWVSTHVTYKMNQSQPVKVITCPTKDKPGYCQPGDILIDDRAVNRDAWMAKGGTYIIHTDAERTIGTLRALGVIG